MPFMHSLRFACFSLLILLHSLVGASIPGYEPPEQKIALKLDAEGNDLANSHNTGENDGGDSDINGLPKYNGVSTEPSTLKQSSESVSSGSSTAQGGVLPDNPHSGIVNSPKNIENLNKNAADGDIKLNSSDSLSNSVGDTTKTDESTELKNETENEKDNDVGSLDNNPVTSSEGKKIEPSSTGHENNKVMQTAADIKNDGATKPEAEITHQKVEGDDSTKLENLNADAEAGITQPKDEADENTEVKKPKDDEEGEITQPKDEDDDNAAVEKPKDDEEAEITQPKDEADENTEVENPKDDASEEITQPKDEDDDNTAVEKPKDDEEAEITQPKDEADENTEVEKPKDDEEAEITQPKDEADDNAAVEKPKDDNEAEITQPRDEEEYPDFGGDGDTRGPEGNNNPDVDPGVAQMGELTAEESERLNDDENVYESNNEEFQNHIQDLRTGLRSGMNDLEEEQETSQSHFFAFLLTTMFCVAALYLLYHNKRKVIALVLPGNQRKTGSRHAGGYNANYERLDNKSTGKQYVF